MQVTATSHGVSSPPTTVYVHQHIDSIVLSAIPDQNPPAGPCLSQGQTFNYQATAFSRGLDITASVGTFIWQSVNTDVATLACRNYVRANRGLLTGQAKVTAHTPGITSLVASTSNVTSQPLDFNTCAVQSIALEVTGSATNTVNVTQGTAKTVTATVIDTLGNTITGVPLTWSSSNPATVAVSLYRRRDDFAGWGRDRDCFLHSSDLQHRIEAAAADLSRERSQFDRRSAHDHHDDNNYYGHGLCIEHRRFFFARG